MHRTRFWHKRAHHTYHRIEVRSCGHHCVHQQPHRFLIRNVFLNVNVSRTPPSKAWLMKFLCQVGLRWACNHPFRIAPKWFDVALLMQGDAAGLSIPFKMNSEKWNLRRSLISNSHLRLDFKSLIMSTLIAKIMRSSTYMIRTQCSHKFIKYIVNGPHGSLKNFYSQKICKCTRIMLNRIAKIYRAISSTCIRDALGHFQQTPPVAPCRFWHPIRYLRITFLWPFDASPSPWPLRLQR